MVEPHWTNTETLPTMIEPESFWPVAGFAGAIAALALAWCFVEFLALPSVRKLWRR